MAFIERNLEETKTEQAERVLSALFNRVLGEDFLSNTDDEPEEEAPAQEEINVDLSTTSLVDKVGMVCHDVLDKLLTGQIHIENAQELVATIKAVDMREDLRRKFKDDFK